MLFQTTKIQTFESNSQLGEVRMTVAECCFRLQRYKILKAIHNILPDETRAQRVVSDYKDTNFWKQFTTLCVPYTKISGCFRLQRYKLLKAIHNAWNGRPKSTSLFQTTKIQTFESNSQPFVRIHWAGMVISDYKDTNFW